MSERRSHLPAGREKRFRLPSSSCSAGQIIRNECLRTRTYDTAGYSNSLNRENWVPRRTRSVPTCSRGQRMVTEWVRKVTFSADLGTISSGSRGVYVVVGTRDGRRHPVEAVPGGGPGTGAARGFEPRPGFQRWPPRAHRSLARRAPRRHTRHQVGATPFIYLPVYQSDDRHPFLSQPFRAIRARLHHGVMTFRIIRGMTGSSPTALGQSRAHRGPRRHVHWFRWSHDDPLDPAGMYACRCGVRRPGL